MRYVNVSSATLNYADSGGPLVPPGEEFEHDIPEAQLRSHLQSGFIKAVAIAEVHMHESRELFDRLNAHRSDT